MNDLDITCPKCNTKNRAEAKFCKDCGVALQEITTQPTKRKRYSMKGLKIILSIYAIYCLLGSIPGIPWWLRRAIYGYPAAIPSMFVIMVGIFFVILARNPLKYGAMLLLAAYGSIGIGIGCLGASLLGGPISILIYWIYSAIFSVVTGVVILIFRKKTI